MSLANELIKGILATTKPTKEAIDEARARCELIKTAAMNYDGALSFIKSGSLAHFTANGIISDADGSLVLDRRTYHQYGPDGDGVGPTDLVTGVAEVIRDTVTQVYPNVHISTNHKRAIYFRFRDPLPDGQDPTVDLVIGLNRKDEPGIWIPNLDDDSWDASDPAKHTELVKARRRSTNHISSKVVRALKLFSKQWDQELLTSFHWTALMLEAYPKQKPLIEGVIDTLNHAVVALADGDTNDPAEVSGSIHLPAGRERSAVIGQINNAASKLQQAYNISGDYEADLDEVAKLFGEVFNKSLASEALETAVLNLRRNILDKAITQSRSSATPVFAEAFNERPVLNTRAFANPTLTGTLAAPSIDLDLSWFEAGLSNSRYFILHRKVDDRVLVYTLNIRLPDQSRTQLVTIKVTGGDPEVFAHGLKGLRHVNGNGTLCLWYPTDPPSRRWTHNKGLVSLLDLVALHLYEEDRFRATGTWLGDEVHDNG